jgi:hypothetical protein
LSLDAVAIGGPCFADVAAPNISHGNLVYIELTVGVDNEQIVRLDAVKWTSSPG